jgi:hypothetical protein
LKVEGWKGPTLGSASGVWTFAGGARLGLQRLDAAFPAEHAWPADVVRLAKAVAALPHSKPRTFGRALPTLGVGLLAGASPGPTAAVFVLTSSETSETP